MCKENHNHKHNSHRHNHVTGHSCSSCNSEKAMKEIPTNQESCCQNDTCESVSPNSDDPDEDRCGCGCSAKNDFSKLILILRLSISFLIATTTFILHEFAGIDIDFYIQLSIYLVTFFIAGYDVVFDSFKGVFSGKLFNENFLMTIASVAAFALGEMYEAILIMVLYGIGELLQHNAINKSRNKISDLMKLRPDMISIKKNNDIVALQLEEGKIGDIMVVKPGEKIGLDGIIIKGNSFLDTSSITGESIARQVVEGDDVLSGSTNLNGLLEIQVTKNAKDSTVNKILEMVEYATSKKAKSERFITKFAKHYTPIVVGLAVLIAVIPPLFGIGTWEEWIYKSLTLLLISCPCALVISIPVTFFAGIGEAAKNGILIKGGNYLEALYHLKSVVFDKTGTLTKGNFKVTQVITNNVTKEELVSFATLAEKNSNHPIAKAITKECTKTINAEIISHEEVTGSGIIVHTTAGMIIVGNKGLVSQYTSEHLSDYNTTSVYVVKDDKYLGCILIEDQIKENSLVAIQSLKEQKINNLVMLTGDKEETASSVSNYLGLTSYKANLLPQEKVIELEKIMDQKANEKDVCAFVGDGINDSPALKRSDIGIAMGGVGSDAAIEACDVVILNDDISKISLAKKIAVYTRRIVKQNIYFSLGTKLIIIILASLFEIPIIVALAADVGVSLLAILNSIRVIKIIQKNKK